MGEASDRWATGDAYEAFMGRWSRPVARAFVEWLQPRRRAHWLDIGCGTGALTSIIIELCEPASIVGNEPSVHFVEAARTGVPDQRASFVVGGADDLPARADGFDAVVSGLVLNFLPKADRAVTSMLQRLSPLGFVGAYVWDYARGMAFLRHFWDKAVAMDPAASELDKGLRFPLCQPEALASLFERAGPRKVETRALEIQTNFSDLDDYWQPLLGGTGPAPAFLASLDADRREEVRERLKQRLPAAAGGSISLRARAWAVRGLAP